MADFNNRIVIFGQGGAQDRRLADAIGKTLFQNALYYPGLHDQLAAALKIGSTPPAQKGSR